MLQLVFFIKCGIVRFLWAMHVFEVWASSSSPHPNFVLFTASIAELAYGEKLRSHSFNHLITHSPSLFDAPWTKALAHDSQMWMFIFWMLTFILILIFNMNAHIQKQQLICLIKN